MRKILIVMLLISFGVLGCSERKEGLYGLDLGDVIDVVSVNQKENRIEVNWTRPGEELNSNEFSRSKELSLSDFQIYTSNEEIPKEGDSYFCHTAELKSGEIVCILKKTNP